MMPTNSLQRMLALATLAVSGFVIAGCGHAAQGAVTGEAAVPVRVAPVASAGSASISATGTLGAKDEIPLAFKIGGVVSSVSVDEGARVRKGQSLATLDLREIDAAVAKAAASRAASVIEPFTGAITRTSPPFVRCSLAASSMSRALLAYSFATTRPRP